MAGNVVKQGDTANLDCSLGHFGVDDDQTDFSERPTPPGNPLRTGFESGRKDGARLSHDAKQRVLEKMRSVDEARVLPFYIGSNIYG